MDSSRTIIISQFNPFLPTSERQIAKKYLFPETPILCKTLSENKCKTVHLDYSP